jgi:IS5 family transposase
MRKARKTQPHLTENWLDADHAKELQEVSRLLDEHPRINELVLQDLREATGSPTAETGAGGLSAEQVLRILLVKQMTGFSFRTLAFHLEDSRTYRTFCRLGILEATPSKSTLAFNIKAVRAETLEAIHRILIGAAKHHKIERGRKVRFDTTVVEAAIHHPTDSALLWDCVRKLTALMLKAQKLLGAEHISFANRTRRAKRRCREINDAKRKEQRKKPYRNLLRATEEVRQMGLRIRGQLSAPPFELAPHEALVAQSLVARFDHFLALTEQVIDQTRRRVLRGESVPAEEKVVSIFEPHTDIIRKDNRETLYGHKICLSVGASSMILDCTVLRGNPPDSSLATSMVDRQVDLYNRPPRQVAFDGSFSSKANLKAIQEANVDDVAFSKHRGITISEMARSTWVYKQLRRFRAGIEGVISFLKRAFGLGRCTWRSWPSFQSYVWGSILACNLLIMARHLMS